MHLPAESAFVIAKLGPRAVWSVEAHLLAHTVDLLAGANWQRAARKGSRQPRPIPRPGDTGGPKHYGNRGRFESPAAFDAVYQEMIANARFREVGINGS